MAKEESNVVQQGVRNKSVRRGDPVEMWHPHGFAVTVKGETRVKEFVKRGYTFDSPKSASKGKSKSKGDDIDLSTASKSKILAWVGDDEDRAREALNAEVNGRERVTVIAALEEIINDEDEDEDDEEEEEDDDA